MLGRKQLGFVYCIEIAEEEAFPGIFEAGA